MDYESLIADLQEISQNDIISIYKRSTCAAAATALSTLKAENEKLRDELEQVRQERDAAVGDMEALMWYSGEGCQICANAVEVHKRPYVRLDCKLGAGIDCKPKWRGKKED